MLVCGITSLLAIQSLGNFTQSDFIAASCIFIAVGGLKMASSVIGGIIYFVKFKPLLMIVREVCIIYILFPRIVPLKVCAFKW